MNAHKLSLLLILLLTSCLPKGTYHKLPLSRENLDFPYEGGSALIQCYTECFVSDVRLYDFDNERGYEAFAQPRGKRLGSFTIDVDWLTISYDINNYEMTVDAKENNTSNLRKARVRVMDYTLGLNSIYISQDGKETDSSDE